LVGIEPEVIQCAKADGIGILVCGKGFSAPGNHAATLIDCPRRATIPQIVESPVVWPPRFLRRRMEPEVTDIRATHWHAKGLNSTIEVLVVKRVLIVPDSGRRVGHLVTHEPDTIVARVGLHLCHRCACRCPRLNSGLHAHRWTRSAKCEVGRPAADSEGTIGDVVIHVALPRVGLTPGVFSR